MLADNKHLYRFGDFILDVEERILTRGGKPVALTPKSFELLRVLILGGGHIIEKKTLMNEVWADSFVEESNLTFTIRQLRKTLGDSARNPSFIETVPRRGYRFIAEVETASEINNGDGDQDIIPTVENGSQAGKKRKEIITPILAVTLGILLLGTIIVGAWYVQNTDGIENLSVLNNSFNSEKISTNGKVFHTVITPDGKNVIYTITSGGKNSVWIRQLESSNNIEIIPPTESFYGGIAVSPDGNFLYYSRTSQKGQRHLDIYRVSIFGGIPTKIAAETQGWIGVSPDGTKISYVRCYRYDDEYCALWIADSADGKNDRKLASRPRPFRIADNDFSPDGKFIAFAVGQSENSSNEFSLAEVEIETGRERRITEENFFDIKGLTWLPDKSGLLITAARIPNRNFLIWQVSYFTGEAKPLTNDSLTYSKLSLDKTASRLVSTNIREDFRIHLLNIEDSSQIRVLDDASTSAFASDGKIVFSSNMSGNEEIWSTNADGSGQKQLTNDSADDTKPVVSPFDNSIYFASNRTGAIQLWRMNFDGSNQMQITNKDSGYPLLVSPDGEWIYYHHGLDKTLRRISKDGTNEQIIWGNPAYRFTVSPDGTKAAFVEKKGDGRILKIISTADKSLLEVIQPAIRDHKMPEIAWMHDGKGLFYIQADGNFTNFTLWRQLLTGNAPQKIADLGNEEISESSGFTAAPDGKSLIYIQGGWRHDAVLLKGLK